jgi:hypothetical protein
MGGVPNDNPSLGWFCMSFMFSGLTEDIKPPQKAQNMFMGYTTWNLDKKAWNLYRKVQPEQKGVSVQLSYM